MSERPLKIFVEGNMAVGKSTFLQYLKGRKNYQVVTEDISAWKNLRSIESNKSFNLLDLAYSEPQKYQFHFQQVVLMSRIKALSRNLPSSSVNFFERSILSNKHVFLKARKFNELDITILNNWIDTLLDTIPELVPDGIVYLRSQPSSCLNRMKSRARKEESSVELDYLALINNFYEKWLIEKDVKLHPRIKDVPILVLDFDNVNDEIFENSLEKIEKFLVQLAN